MWAYLASRGTATSRSEIKERGLYGLSGDKPGNGEYFAYSFGKQGVEWNFPVLVLTAYGDTTPAYLFSMITSDGISYSPSEYIGLATKDDLPNLETEWNVADSGIVLRCVSGDGSAIQLATTPDGIQLQKRSSSSGNWEVVWAK